MLATLLPHFPKFIIKCYCKLKFQIKIKCLYNIPMLNLTSCLSRDKHSSAITPHNTSTRLIRKPKKKIKQEKKTETKKK